MIVVLYLCAAHGIAGRLVPGLAEEAVNNRLGLNSSGEATFAPGAVSEDEERPSLAPDIGALEWGLTRADEEL